MKNDNLLCSKERPAPVDADKVIENLKNISPEKEDAIREEITKGNSEWHNPIPKRE